MGTWFPDEDDFGGAVAAPAEPPLLARKGAKDTPAQVAGPQAPRTPKGAPKGRPVPAVARPAPQPGLRRPTQWLWVAARERTEAERAEDDRPELLALSNALRERVRQQGPDISGDPNWWLHQAKAFRDEFGAPGLEQSLPEAPWRGWWEVRRYHSVRSG